MPSFLTEVVTGLLSERRGLQRVELAGGRRAYALTELVGPVAVGDRVVLNTTAVELGLGTGGWDVVHWNLSRQAWSSAGRGRVMKLRYTSLQADVGAAEEGTEVRPAADLAGVPVVACGLHSQLAAVAVAFAEGAPGRRLVHVMTDSAALPLALSDLAAALGAAGLLAATVTCGQAFGGDHEAVNLYSGLQVARGIGADAVVVAPGPGVVGTGTGLGFSGLEVAAIVDAAAALHGRPVAVVRYSDADARPRHRGVSHHTRTALALAHRPALVAVPLGQPKPFDDRSPHQVVEVEVGDVPALFAARGLEVTTMGRSPVDDAGFFRYAAAAGVAAAALVTG